MFQDYFLLHFLFNVLRLQFLLFGSMFQDFSSLSHIKNPFHFYSFIYTCPQPFMPSHLKYTDKSDVIYLQPFKDTYITLTLWYHLILTCVSRLWPRKGDCIFYSVIVAYGFDVEVGCCGFCESCDLFCVFGCLRFWFKKVINVFCFRTKEKEKEKEKF